MAFVVDRTFRPKRYHGIVLFVARFPVGDSKQQTAAIHPGLLLHRPSGMDHQPAQQTREPRFRPDNQVTVPALPDSR